jgi:hypothetical protein
MMKKEAVFENLFPSPLSTTHPALSPVFKELHFFCTEIKKIVQIFQRKEKLNHFSTIYCLLF